MSTTIFQKIVAREIPAEVVYENEHVIAFLDINPKNPGHTLVVPKVFCENIFDVDAESWQQVMSAVHMLAPHVRDAVQAEGVNIVNSNGIAAGQEVPHLHIHIIPRFTGDTPITWAVESYAEGKQEQVGKAIRLQLATD